VAVLEQQQQDDLLSNMVNPFSSNPFERQTQSFLDRLRADEERQRREIAARAEQRAKNLQLARRRQAERQEAAELQAALQKFQKPPIEDQSVEQGLPIYDEPTPPEPAVVKGIDVSAEEPFNFTGGFAPGVRSNLANAGITALGAIEPAINAAVGLGSRLLPGDQEFDKQFRQVMEERQEAGKPAGARQFLAASVEAARRAQPTQQGAEIFASWALPWLDAFGNAGIPQDSLDEFQKLREQYFEEETGESWEGTGFFRNATADIRASRRAYNEIDLPKFYKGAMEVFLEPLNLVPGAGWVNDARFVKSAALTAGRAAVLSPGAVRAIPQLPSRIKETWNAASQIPAEDLTSLKAKQDLGQEIVDESNISTYVRQFHQQRGEDSRKLVEAKKAVEDAKKEVNTARKTVKKSISEIEKIQDQIKNLVNESKRKATSIDRKQIIQTTLLPSLRQTKKTLSAAKKEQLSNLNKKNDDLDQLIKVSEEKLPDINTAERVKDLAKAQAGERTTEQVFGRSDYVDPVVVGEKADSNVALKSEYYETVDDATKKSNTSNSLYEDAEKVIKESQGGSFSIKIFDPTALDDMNVAQKLGYKAGQLVSKIPGSETVASKTPDIPIEVQVNLQDVIRGSFNKLPENIQMPLQGVVGSVTPKLLANLNKPNLGVERIKNAIINSRLQSTASVVVNKIKAKTGSAASVFGEALEDGSLININSLDPQNAAFLVQQIRNRLSSRYSETTDLSAKQIQDALSEIEAGKFHESDVLNAVVEVRQYRNAKGVTEVVYDLAEEFKSRNNIFWQDGKLTTESHYFTQRAKAYGEFAKLLEETGIPVRVSLNGTTVALSGAARVRHLLSDGAFASRYVWTRKTGTAKVSDGGFDKYYNNARTLLDPDELLARVQSGSISYVSPDDTLSIYASAVYKQIADIALEERLITLFRENPDFAKKYNVVVKAEVEPSLKGGESFVKIGGASKESGYRLVENVKYKLDKSGDVTSSSQTSRERLFDGLLFSNSTDAAKFAQDFDVLLETADSNPFMQRVKHWITTSSTSRTAADFGRILRIGGTGIDIGLLAIYGPIVMGKGTSDILKGLSKGGSEGTRLVRQGQNVYKGLANATVDSFISLARPDQVLARTYRPERQKILRRANAANLHLSRAQVEAYEALNSNGPLSNWLTQPTSNVNWPSRAKSSLSSTLKRFEGSWSTFIDEVKISTFDSLTSHLDEVTDAQEIRQIADFVNKATGTLSSEAAGLTNFQRHIESTFLFFSPRMTRSMLALLSDGMTKGGVQGQLARESVITANVALQAFTWGVGQALGQNVNLDPTQPHYLQIKIGNDYVGPGSQLVSLTRAATRLIAGPDDQASVYQDFNEDGSYKNQEWFKTLRSRALSAPVGSAVADFLLNEDFYGTPYNGFTDIAAAQARKGLPFWLQDVVVADPYRLGWSAASMEFAGLRTRALTPYERSRQLRDQAVAEKYGSQGFTTYNSLDPVRKKEINAELKSGDSSSISANVLRDYQSVDEIIEDVRENADANSTQVDDYYEELDFVSSKKASEKAEVFRKLETTPGQTKADVRQALSKINSDFASEYETIFDKSETGKYADVHEFLDRLENTKGTERKEQTWINSYFETILFNSAFEKITSEGVEYFDYAAYEDAKRTWISRYGSDAHNYIQEYLNTGEDIHPVEAELIFGREKYGYNYWQAPKLAAIEQTALKLGVSIAEVEGQYDQWNNGAVETKAILGQSQVIKSINTLISKMRKSLRELDQGLDGFLFSFAYTSSLVHEGNSDISARSLWRSKQANDENFYNSFSPTE